MSIERDQWANWKDHPCTQEMVKVWKELREYGFQAAANGALDERLLQLGINLGELNCLTRMINFEFIQIEDDNDR